MRKRGREGRAHAPRAAWQPLPPSRRSQRAAARSPAGRRERKRTPPPAPAPGRTRPSRDPTRRALGRPRLRLQTARTRPARPPDRTRISKRRRAGDPLPPGPPGREVWRGRKRQPKTPDPLTRQRWPLERTNAWLKAKRRIATRRDRKADNYLAFLHLGMILILTRPL